MNRQKSLNFNKSERLRHKTLVDNLFEQGQHVTVFPMKFTWRLLSEEELKSAFRTEVPDRLGRLQVMFTVPKRKLRHAVDRVAMRRRMREAWRLNRCPLKEFLSQSPDVRSLSVACVYLADHRYSSEKIKVRMIKALDILTRDVKNYLEHGEEDTSTRGL